MTTKPGPKFSSYTPHVERVKIGFGADYYTAVIGEIPGCRAQGKTKEQALLMLEKEFKTIAKSWAMKKQKFPRPGQGRR